MDRERAVTKGYLETDKRNLQKLEIKADQLIADLRALLSPYADSIIEVDMERVGVLVDELKILHEKGTFLKRKVRQYEEALYG